MNLHKNYEIARIFMDPYRFSTSNRVGPPRNGRKSYGPARRTSRKPTGCQAPLRVCSASKTKCSGPSPKAAICGGVDTRFFLWHKNGIS